MFEWDAAKDAENIRRRGLPFADAATIFGGPVLEVVDCRRDYGEVRIIAVGEAWNGEILTVVYTWRGKTRRIISARTASRRERNGYRAQKP
ncbi:MAG TPA: BrnT family toxin [Alphaproteobacteria bacterium]|nr:BrnT family toxin [Alphaproteobacteria bacterium]